MKFIYDESYRLNFQDYGILIPINPSRYIKSYQALREHPLFSQDSLIPYRGRQINKDDLLRVHDKSYVERLFGPEVTREMEKVFELFDEKGNPHRYDPHKGKYPLKQMFKKVLMIASGTYQSCKEALKGEDAFFFGGGMHHGHHDHGSGFCPINDIVIAAQKILKEEQSVSKIWIIDVDAHKGDGTAALTEKQEDIQTLSIHMARGWPLGAEALKTPYNPVFLSSNVDIGIESGEENQYIPKLKAGLNELAAKGKADLAIVVLGSDPYEEDELPSTTLLNLNLEQMLERDRLVVNFLKEHQVPSAYLMAGGYGENSWKVYSQFFNWILEKEDLKS